MHVHVGLKEIKKRNDFILVKADFLKIILNVACWYVISLISWLFRILNDGAYEDEGRTQKLNFNPVWTGLFPT